jgi:ubiquinone/menaquinone biosynthesis C-methylase UbiE
MPEDTPYLYDDHHIAFLEAVWGDGFLSPGGPDEVSRMLDGLDLSNRTVVDIGSGAGGIAILLAGVHGAGRVVGLDVEEPVVAHSRKKIASAGLSDKVEIRLVEPGPMPLEDESVDVVFSKDSIVHIPDKETLAKDVFRVLKPGGMFVASDWLISHDGPPSPEMAAYIAAEDLDFGMASPSRYRAALENAGFVDVVLSNRNEWYREEAPRELARLEGADRARFAATLPGDGLDGMIDVWRKLVGVLRSGEHCPHHFRARKPG